MRLPDTTQEGVKRLDRFEESEHFIVHYSMRNPQIGMAGPGMGAYGIRDYHVMSHYITALERVYRVLTGPSFSWESKPKAKIEAFVLYLPSVGMNEPFTAVDLDWVPYVCLPCRSEVPSLQNALHQAQVEAVHEVTHVFCWSARPPKRLVEKKWLWFGEGTAVFMEGEVYPANPDSIRFAMDWCDFPEWPLDEGHAWYQASFFVRYLAHRFGSQIVSKIWNESLSNDGPFDALGRLSLPGVATSSSSICPVYGEYAHDSFFLWDHRSYAFHPEVFLRFGSRAITECFVLGSGDHVPAKGQLDHLSCRYYRIDLKTGVNRVEVEFRALQSGDAFRCFLTAHQRSQHRGAWKELKSTPLVSAGKRTSLGRTRIASAALGGADIDACEWLLLTVANCGIKSRADDPSGQANDDGKKFEIEIRAH